MNTFQEPTRHALLPLIGFLGVVMLTTVIIQTVRTVHRTEAMKSARPLLEYRPNLPGQPLISDAGVEEAERTDQPDVFLLVRSALVKWRNSDFRGAENDLKTVLVFQPDNLTALSYLGTLCHNTGDFKTAEFFFRKQTAAFPTYSAGYLNLSTVLLKQNRFPEALGEAERAYQLDPKAYNVSLHLAKIHAYHGEKELAVFYFQRAAAADPRRTLESVWDPMLDSVRNEPEFRAALTALRKKVAEQHQ